MSMTTPIICQWLWLCQQLHGYTCSYTHMATPGTIHGNTRDDTHDYIYNYIYDYAHDYAPQLCHKATPTNSFYGSLYTPKDNITVSISFHTFARLSLPNIFACKTWEALMIHEKLWCFIQCTRSDHFQFDLVFIEKSNRTSFFKPKPVQTDRFQFGSVWLF